MTQFFETRMGHTFYEGTMPSIARALTALAKHFSEGKKEEVEQRIVCERQSPYDFGCELHVAIDEGWKVAHIDAVNRIALLERSRKQEAVNMINVLDTLKPSA